MLELINKYQEPGGESLSEGSSWSGMRSGKILSEGSSWSGMWSGKILILTDTSLHQ